jgi:penicillin-insensitive murein endopeptidase
MTGEGSDVREAFRHGRWKRAVVIVLSALFVLFAILHPRSPGTESICFGTPAAGRIENAASLPHHGNNFSSYSTLGWLLGRQHVHSRVHATLIDATKTLETSQPGLRTVFGETGWPWGGRFRPHRTHRNGTSVDIMVPVRRDDQSVPFPSASWNGFGYAVEFDRQGSHGDYRIDYDAMVAQLLALSRAARGNGIGIDVVIFDNILQQQLWQARDGRKLQQAMRFSRTPAWIRHDEHYHINFRVPCG